MEIKFHIKDSTKYFIDAFANAKSVDITVLRSNTVIFKDLRSDLRSDLISNIIYIIY